jgi:glycerol-3-phosphate acyltransferase PlsY
MILLVILIGYLLGSIPFGLILTRLAGLGDIRAIGSGNIGATNVLRTGNKPLAAATLLLDAAKGAVAVLLARHFGPNAAMAAGFAALLGHLFPIWLKFKGGKGVATGLGILLAASLPLGLFACLIWAVTATLTRYSSLAAMIAFWFTPALAVSFGGGDLIILAAALTILIVWKHRANISRLRAGTEPKIGKTA